MLSLGVAGAWIFGPKMGEKTYKLLELTGPLLGFTGLGSAVVQFLTDKDQYLTDEKAEEAKQKRQQEEMENQGGDD